MEFGASRIACGLAAGVLAVAFAAIPSGAAEARVGGGGMHARGTPWVHGGRTWHGAGWNRGWHGNYARYGRYGRYGYGYGYGRYGYPLATGLAAGALLAAPYAYGNSGYYGDDYYGGTRNCRTELVPRGNIHTRYFVQETVCD